MDLCTVEGFHTVGHCFWRKVASALQKCNFMNSESKAGLQEIETIDKLDFSAKLRQTFLRKRKSAWL
jgi:hypothetical protein